MFSFNKGFSCKGPHTDNFFGGERRQRKNIRKGGEVLLKNKFNRKKSKYLFAKQKTACELMKYGSNACSNFYLYQIG